MIETNNITPARQAMLELIKKNNRINSSNSSNNSSDSDNEKSKKKRPVVDKSNQPKFKRELDEKRRSAYIVRLGGK